MEMGCYGIGITRTVAAAVEQHHDADGIQWPISLAPVTVQIVPVNWNDELSRTTAEGLYSKLLTAGIDTLLDDREERAGVKFKDADLLGTPLRVTIGPKALARGMVELKLRTEKQGTDVSLDQIVPTLVSLSREKK